MKQNDWTSLDIPSQADRTAVVTGANSGIGWHTALELARAGSDVILTARSEEKGQDAIDRIRQEVPKARIRAEILDLASLKSVHEFAERLAFEPKLDLLVNNAGVMSIPERRTTHDGFEMQLGTNFLGPFALTALLMPVLQRSPNARVTTVSSGAANMGMKRIDFDDLQSEKSYNPWKAYCQSKLADLLFSQELARRDFGILSNAAHPGYAITNLQSSGPGRLPNLFERLFAKIAAQDAAHGALPTLRAATSPEAISGSYFAPNGLFQLKGDPIPVGVPKPAQDVEMARELWDVACRVTGVSFESPTPPAALRL